MTTIRKGIIYVYMYVHGMHFPCKVHIVQVAITRAGSEQSQSFPFSQNKPLFETSINVYI